MKPQASLRNIPLFFLISLFWTLVSSAGELDFQKINTIAKWIKYTESNCSLENHISVLNMHTAGEGASLVLNNLDLPGKTMREKINSVVGKNSHSIDGEYSYLHKTIIKPPIGHVDAFAAIITNPVLKESDNGIFFMESAAILDMCGHNTLAAAIGLIELGWVPGNTIKFDTAAGGGGKNGVVEANALQETNKQISEVTIKNVKSFPLDISGKLNDELLGDIDYELAYGGNVFAIIDIDKAKRPMEIIPANIDSFLKAGDRIRHNINKEWLAKGKISHNNFGDEKKLVELVEFYTAKVNNPDKTAALHLKNVVIFGQEGNPQADRSPCGTGTSAKMALLNQHKKLSPGQIFVYESIIGTKFKGRFTKETSTAKEIVPYITASAYITGSSQYIRNDKPSGYSLSSLRTWKNNINEHYAIPEHIKVVDYHIGERGTRICYDYKSILHKEKPDNTDIVFLGKIMTQEPRGYDGLTGAIIIQNNAAIKNNTLLVHFVKGDTLLTSKELRNDNIAAVAAAGMDLELVTPDKQNTINLKINEEIIPLKIQKNSEGKVERILTLDNKELGKPLLMSFSQFILDRRDKFTYGFSLKK